MSSTQQKARGTDSTPLFTRMVLIATLVVTGFALGMSGEVAPVLWLFTALFVLRVGGQILVALQPRSWLPPMEQWNLVPYPVLLPIQIVFIVVMLWIDLAFTANTGIAAAEAPRLGTFLIAFSAVYALSMAVRYVLRMSRRPDQRWFGGTIPIVFHLVLAAYVYVLGNTYAG